MIINIPLCCPKCGGKMYATKYDSPLAILRERTWHVCRECPYNADAEVFKRSICRA